MDRRSFIKLTAVSGTTAALTSCGNPDAALVRFVPDEEIVQGIATWKPSVCPLCAAGCGLSVRVMDADYDVVRNGQAGVVRIHAAKKLEGGADNPVNQGKLCARGQAAIQVTYHPDRITQPLKRAGNRGDGRYTAISWDDALAEVVTKLDALEGAGSQRALAFLVGQSRGHRGALVEAFLARFGAPAATTFELFSDDVLRLANGLSFGREQLPTFDLANARSVISFGADFLGTWNSPVSQSAAYGRLRQGRAGIRGAFIQVESRMSQTGANADEWVPVTPGTDGVLALGIAHVLMTANLRQASAAGQAGSRIEGWNSGLAAYAPEQVEKITGVAAARVERLARLLAEMSPSVAMIGGTPLAHTSGLFSALAVNALSALLGGVGTPGGLFFTPQFGVAEAAKLTRRTATLAPRNVPGVSGVAGRATVSLERLVSDLLAGAPTAPQVLFVDGTNPVFTAPKAWSVGEGLAKVPFIVSFGSFLDETSGLADLILPDHSFLESWVESVPESGAMVGVVNAAPPTMRPLHDTRATADVLLDLSRRLRRPLELPWETFEAMLTATFASLPASVPEGDTWAEVQERGGWWGGLPAAVVANLPAPAAEGVLAAPQVFAEPQFGGDAQQFPLHFLPYPSSAFLDGSLAHLPWLQEMPDPLTSAMWSTWVEINPKTAERAGIRDGDVVEVTSAHGAVRAAAVVSPGIAPDVVAMPVGQGHTSFTRYASGRGVNPADILAPATVPGTGTVAWASTRVKIARVGDPDGRLILFAGGSREEDHEHPHR
jgi:anaerobic selenocysteine-containing dehydrogenase